MKATFGAGCFWGVEERFRKIRGVVTTQVGYAGGHMHNPTYKDVCGGATGHAEVVEVTFDPEEITYEELLDDFWKMHNPSASAKDQYRSAIFAHSEEQLSLALASRDHLAAQGVPVLTEIKLANSFWRAEEYHQRYFEKQQG